MNKQEQFKFIEDNYPLYTNHISNRRIRHDFFSKIETELQAYLLGFYAADGNINEKRKTFRIHLQKQDSDLVYLYKDIISPDARIFTIKEHETTGRNGMKIMAHESFGVDITSSKLCNDLVNLGIGYNKSYTNLHIPKMPEHLIPHFLRGYFDGDGCFTEWYSQESGKSERIRGKFDICGKTIGILDEFIKFFAKHNIKLNLNFLKRDNMYRISTSSRKEITKIFHLLYDNSNFYLNRKFEKFNHHVNTEVTQLIAEHRNAQEMNVSNSNNSPKSSEQPIMQVENVR